jgi:hypothetical protein
MLEEIESLSERLARLGWVLRTGASPGADQAFYRGARHGGGRVELYLPWPGFEEDSWRDARAPEVSVLAQPSRPAYELGAHFHPDWAQLEDSARDLLARDAHEVLGADLRSPVERVVCWTADGSLDGTGAGADGTRQALRIAHHNQITVSNVARPAHLRCLNKYTADELAGAHRR